MEEREIDRLERLAEEGHKCTFLEICDEEKYDQCCNHSHVLCGGFKTFYRREGAFYRRENLLL